MASITIPAKKALSLKNEGSTFDWAPGAYSGVFEEFEVRELPSQKNGDPFAGYTSVNGDRLAITIGNIEPMENQPTPGNRKWFVDLALSVESADGKSVYTVESYDEAPKEAWQLERSARYITNLGATLGAIKEEGENVTVADGFVDSLKDGSLKGNKIGFVVYKKGKYSEIESFFIVS